MRIGIVTVSYNQGDFLPEAVESVQLSRRCDLDYVIVDPGSSDGSLMYIERERGRFSHAICESDDGPADGLNKGFSRLTSDVFGYLNADDRFAPGALDYVLSVFCSNPTVDVLCGAIRIIDVRGRRALRGRLPNEVNLRRYMIGASFVWQQATFFTRKAFERVGGFNVHNRTCWDGELIVDMALAGCKFLYVNKVLGEFRIHPGSITGSQRLSRMYIEDQRRMALKICAAGIPSYSAFQRMLILAGYRLDLIRHVREGFL